MMSIRNCIYSLFLVFLFYSCDRNQKNDILCKFQKKEKISHTSIRLNNDSIFSKVYGIFCFNKNLIAYDVDGSFLFSVTDLEKKTMLSKFGKLGQGPNEVLGLPTAVSFAGKNSISFFEPNKGILHTVNFENPLSPLQQNTKFSNNSEDIIMTLVPLPPDLFIATGVFSHGRYLLLEKNGRRISYNFNYPKISNEKIFTNAHKAIAFQGKLVVRPDGKRFFFACEDSEIFEIIKVEKDNKLNKIYEFHGELAIIRPEGNGVESISAAIDRTSRTKFVDACCSQNFIYLLYANKIIGNDLYNSYLANTILVFDWNGKPIKVFQLDTDLRYISINEDDSVLYGIDPNSETTLVKFTL